jgi:hypothetical protein
MYQMSNVGHLIAPELPTVAEPPTAKEAFDSATTAISEYCHVGPDIEKLNELIKLPDQMTNDHLFTAAERLEGMPFEDYPVCEWPDWLFREAIAPDCKKRNPELTRPSHGGLRSGALAKLDVMEFQDYDQWLRLMVWAKRSGIGVEEFVRWSTADPRYAGDGDCIERQWNGLADGGISVARKARLVELRADRNHGCKPLRDYNPNAGGRVVQGSSLSATFRPNHSFPSRMTAILRSIRDEQGAFNAACSVREMIFQGLTPWVGVKMLRQGGVGDATIAAGFLQVETKLSKGV